MNNLQEDLKLIRRLVDKMGWKEFMSHVSGLLAEQSDKTSGEQSSALFASSNTLSALSPVWEVCGKFKYPDDMI